MTLPIVHLTGTAYEQGVQHGEALKSRIAHNLDVYFARFERETGLPKPEVLNRASRYAGAIAGQNRDYFDGMRGVADGSGFPLEEIAALQVRYEILYYQFGKNAESEDVDGCTAFAVLPEASANGHLLVGQNWDWIPQVLGAVVHTTDPDGLETLAFTEAGIVGGKIGFNNLGVGLAINGMTSTDDDWSTLAKPFHVRCYEILRSHDFDTAVAVVTSETRACSTNFLIAQTPDKVVDIEAAPDKLRLLGCEGGCLVHTNNFTDPAEIGVTEPPNIKRPFSIGRRSRLGELLAVHDKISIADIQTDLQDHLRFPYGICRHAAVGLEPPQNHYITVTAVVMDLTEKTLMLTDGVPCENEFQTVTLIPPILFPCPCCGYLVFKEPPGTYAFCPVCAWEDDLSQLRFATFPGGANKPSLVEAQLNYVEHGTSQIGRKPRAQSPMEFERDENWRLIDLKLDNIELSSIGDQGKTYPKDRTSLYYWRETYWRQTKAFIA